MESKFIFLSLSVGKATGKIV